MTSRSTIEARVISPATFLNKVRVIVEPLLAGNPAGLDALKKPILHAHHEPNATDRRNNDVGRSVSAPFEIDFDWKPFVRVAAEKPDPSDAGKSSLAAEAVAKAAAEAYTNGETVDGVVTAANVVVNAFELVKDSVGARAARAVANVAGSRRNNPASSPQDVADAARSFADAVKTAEGKGPGSKTADPTSTALPEVSKDLPPASAKAAFESVLPIGTTPAMLAAGDYEYRFLPRRAPQRALALLPRHRLDCRPFLLLCLPLFLRLLPRQPTGPRRVCFFAVKYGTPTQTALAEQYRRRAAWKGASAVQSQLVSLANPGLGHSVHLGKNESLVIGFCSFNDQGGDAKYDWVALKGTKGRGDSGGRIR